MVPKMLEMFPPVTRPRILEVGAPVLFRKLAILLLGTLKLPKLWNRFVPPPGLVPPVMSYCTCPGGGVADRVICVFSPDGVIGGCARATERGIPLRRESARSRDPSDQRVFPALVSHKTTSCGRKPVESEKKTFDA